VPGAAAAGPHAPAAGSWVVRRLEVADLRCWDRLALDLPGGLVVVHGPNGAGKTSLVEAVVAAALGVSPRTPRMAELVRHGAPAFHVRMRLTAPGGGDETREIGYAPGTGRRLSRDGVPERALAGWRRPAAVLVFVPEELRAVKGPPAARRRALDRLLEALDPGFAAASDAYGQALMQRNALLRRARAAGRADAGAVVPWETAMASHGARLVRARRGAIAALAAPFADWLDRLGGGGGGRIALESSPTALGPVGDDDLEGALAAGLADRRTRDLAAGMTLSGPHRDDVWIGRGDHDLRRLGSQGEQRTAALALLLAHRTLLERAGARPVLLLDDVLSELDPDRRRALVSAVSGPGQAILTTADPDVREASGAGGTALRVEGGGVARAA